MGTPLSARIRRHTSMPSSPGSMTSSSTRSGRDSRKAPDRLGAVGHVGDLEPLVAQHDPEHLGECEVVVDDQNPSLHDTLLPGTADPAPRMS